MISYATNLKFQKPPEAAHCEHTAKDCLDVQGYGDDSRSIIICTPEPWMFSVPREMRDGGICAGAWSEKKTPEHITPMLWQKSPVYFVPAAFPNFISSLTDLGACSQKHKQFAQGHTRAPNEFPFRKPVGKNSSTNTCQLVFWFIFLHAILCSPKSWSTR